MSFRDGNNETQNDVTNLDAEAMLEDFALPVDAFLLECRVQLFLVFPVIRCADSFCFKFSVGSSANCVIFI